MIPKEDIVEMVYHPELAANLNVFCMFSWAPPKVDNDKIMLDRESQLGSLRQLSKEYGPHAVLVKNVSEFFARVRSAAARQGSGVLKAKGKLVTYSEAHDMPTNIDQTMDLAFHKRKQYANEKEFRFTFLTNQDGPFIIDIADIRDIAALMRTEEIYEEIRVNGSADF